MTYRTGCRTSVTVNNSPIQDYVHPNDHILNRTWNDSWSDDYSLRSRRLEEVNARKNGRASLTRVPVLSCAHYFQAPATQATTTENTSVFVCAFASGFTWPISCQNLWTQPNLFLITYYSYVYFFPKRIVEFIIIAPTENSRTHILYLLNKPST